MSKEEKDDDRRSLHLNGDNYFSSMSSSVGLDLLVKIELCEKDPQLRGLRKGINHGTNLDFERVPSVSRDTRPINEIPFIGVVSPNTLAETLV